MKLIDLTCPKCGASLQVNEELKSGMCNHCGHTFLVDDEVQKVKITDSMDAGYEFEQGRIKAQKEEEIRQVTARLRELEKRKAELIKKKERDDAANAIIYAVIIGILVVFFLWLVH